MTMSWHWQCQRHNFECVCAPLALSQCASCYDPARICRGGQTFLAEKTRRREHRCRQQRRQACSTGWTANLALTKVLNHWRCQLLVLLVRLATRNTCAGTSTGSDDRAPRIYSSTVCPCVSYNGPSLNAIVGYSIKSTNPFPIWLNRLTGFPRMSTLPMIPKIPLFTLSLYYDDIL